MDGDQPSCSKDWKEPDPEQDAMETEPTDETKSADQGGGDASGVEDVEGPWQLPAPCIREIGDLLQTCEVKHARLVCSNWTTHLDYKFLQKSRRFAVNATSYQWEPIHYSHALYHPRMNARIFHCGAHHPMTDKIYMFGGNGPQRNVDNFDFDAHYNDLWTYDLHLKKWDRLLVPGTPYPTPKSRSSFVAWKEYLVLFGGFRRPNRRNRSLGAAEFPERINGPDQGDDSFDYDGPDRGSLPREVHYLNVKRNVWETATPVYRETPGLYPALHDHGAAVFGKWMVVVGGLRSTPWEESVFINTQIFLFDLEEKVWHVAPKAPETPADKLNRPGIAEFARGTLVLIRPGRMLYHPCFPIRYPPVQAPPPMAAPAGLFAMFNAPPAVLPVQAMMHRQRDELRCYFLDFNPADMLGENWRWTPVPVVSPHILRATGPLAAPVAVHSNDRVRLVNIVSETRRTRRISDLNTYNGLQSFVAKIKTDIQMRLADNTEAQFYDSLAESPFEFELDCYNLYRHRVPIESGGDALKLIVSVLQGRSGHLGDYKVTIRFLDIRYTHVIAKGVINFIEETTVGYLPIKGGGKSPHAASTEKTLQMVRQSSRKYIKVLKADLTGLDRQPIPQLVWEETTERPPYEEQPLPSTGLLLLQADGTLFVTGGESKPDEDGAIDTSIGGGTWVGNPFK